MKTNCQYCGKEIEWYGGVRKYCSNQCQRDNEYQAFIKKWLDGKETRTIRGEERPTHRPNGSICNAIRRYLFEKYNNKCCKCGWSETNLTTGKIPLEVDHKDGDCTNNKEENLELLCPNCHSLTPNYKGSNKKGRGKRLGRDNRLA